MIQIVFPGREDVDDVIAFYATHAPYGLLYPRDPQWIKGHVGTNFSLIGIRVRGELATVAWIARLKDFVYFAIENECLVLKNDGAYVYSGGWCIRADYQGKGLFQLLTAAVNSFWFTHANRSDAPTLWGRMVGRKDIDGNPLFWNRVGERITGISYGELLALPFGSMEGVIFERWPKAPVALQDVPPDILEETLGKTFDPLVGPLNRFVEWGFVEVTDQYVPTSLNRFQRTTKDSIRDPDKFLADALSNALRKLGQT